MNLKTLSWPSSLPRFCLSQRLLILRTQGQGKSCSCVYCFEDEHGRDVRDDLLDLR